MVRDCEDVAVIDPSTQHPNESWYETVERMAAKHNTEPLVIAGMLGLTPCPAHWHVGKTQNEINKAYRVKDNALLH